MGLVAYLTALAQSRLPSTNKNYISEDAITLPYIQHLMQLLVDFWNKSEKTLTYGGRKSPTVTSTGMDSLGASSFGGLGKSGGDFQKNIDAVVNCPQFQEVFGVTVPNMSAKMKVRG